MDTHYPIRAVSKLTGLSIDTLRAWERRYQAVVPQRRERGRQYSPDLVQRLILLRELVHRGHAIGQIAALPDADLRNLLEAAPRSPWPDTSPSASIAALADQFANFENTPAIETLGRMAALLSPRDLIFEVVLPLMGEVGERWHAGTMGIAQEHLVSTAIRNLFGSLARLYPSLPTAPKMILATLPGELHEIGILAAAMIATISGWNALFIGSNLPAAECVEAARKTASEIVVMAFCDSAVAMEELADLSAALPAGAEVWIGGRNSPTASVPGVTYMKDLYTFETACHSRAFASTLNTAR